MPTLYTLCDSVRVYVCVCVCLMHNPSGPKGPEAIEEGKRAATLAGQKRFKPFSLIRPLWALVKN